MTAICRPNWRAERRRSFSFFFGVQNDFCGSGLDHLREDFSFANVLLDDLKAALK